MVGSSQSMSGPNIYLNAAVADILSEVADRLEKADDKDAECHAIIREFYREHRRVVFNGNGYSMEWVKEAKRRGLPNFTDTVSALPQVMRREFVEMFERQRVFSREELASRLEIYLETYSKQINIEASIMVEMVRKSIIPAVTRYVSDLCESIVRQRGLGFDVTAQKQIAGTLSKELNMSITCCERLHISIAKALSLSDDALAQATCYRDEVLDSMKALRGHVDILETYTDKKAWPFPAYDDLLFRL